MGDERHGRHHDGEDPQPDDRGPDSPLGGELLHLAVRQLGGDAHQGVARMQAAEDQAQDHAADADQDRDVEHQQDIDRTMADLAVGGGRRRGVGVLVVEVVVVLGLDVGHAGEEERDGEQEDHDGHARVRDPEGFGAGALALGILAIEEQAAGNGPEDPAHAVERLGQVDAGGRIAFVAEHRGVRVGDGLEEGEAGGDHADAQQEGPERGDLGGRNEPEPAHRHHQQAGDDAALVAEFRRQPAGRQRHQEIPEVMGELDPGRLRQGQVKFLLEMLVHHVDHPVAEPPEEEQRADEKEGEDHPLAVGRDEHALLLGVHAGRNAS